MSEVEKMQRLLAKSMEHISNAVAPVISLNDPVQHMFCMMHPGLGVNPDDYDPNTEKGQRGLALLCDKIPFKTKIYIPSPTTVTEEYAKVLQLLLPEDPELTPQQKAKYEQSKAQLVEPGYQKYEEALRDYEEAIRGYYRAKNENATEDRRRALWSEVERCDRALTAAGRGKYEEALSNVKYFDGINAKAIVTDAETVFRTAQIGGNNPFRRVQVTPSTWASDLTRAVGGNIHWTTVALTESSTDVAVHSDYRQMKAGFSAEAHGFFWSAEVSAGIDEELRRANLNAKTHDMGLSMQIAAVDIQRPWFRGGLLTLKRGKLANIAKHGLCSGSIRSDPPSASGSFDIRPTRIVLVKSLTITNSLHTSEIYLLEQRREEFVRARGKYCGNRVAADYQFNKGNQDTALGTDYYKCEIIVPSPQIIGFVCAVHPAFPPEDPPTTTYAARPPLVIDTEKEFEAIAMAEQLSEFGIPAMPPQLATPGHY